MTIPEAEIKSREKWNRIYSAATKGVPQPCEVLADYSYLLPSKGKALDIACGLGGNALALASAGLSTTAIDISDTAIDKLKHQAVLQGLELTLIVGAASNAFFRSNEEFQGYFDVITVANYLDRDLFVTLPELLAPSGLLFYQTFVRDKSSPENGPSNPDFLLDTNELLTLTQSLVCRVFYDLGNTGATDCGLRNQSCIVLQKGV